MTPTEGVQWHRIVLDESHYIKNHQAMWSKACLDLTATHKVSHACCVKNRFTSYQHASVHNPYSWTAKPSTPPPSRPPFPRTPLPQQWCVTGTPMCLQVADIVTQMEFLGLNHTESTTLLRQKLGGTGGGKRRWDRHCRDDTLVYMLSNFMMRHTLTQERQGQKLLVMKAKHERVLKIPFEEAERKAYQALSTELRATYTTLVESGGVSRNMIKLLAMLAMMRAACSPGAAMIPPKRVAAAAAAAGEDVHGRGGGRKAKEKEAEAEVPEECPICLEEMESPTTTQCGHNFCHECIVNTLNSAPDVQDQLCPVCRTNITVKKLKPSAPKPGGSGGGMAGLGLGGRIEPGFGVSDATRALCESTVLESKFAVLLKELARVKAEDPTAKSLVFSQFTSTIDALKVKLGQHGFSWRSLAGDMSLAARSKALEEFQNDPPTTIFLLSIRAGAVGINLTQANQVFLLEPCLNPALEAQAIGRVHRMGQRREVHVTKLVMEGSVEEKIITTQKRVTQGGKQATVDNDAAASSSSSSSSSSASSSSAAASGDASNKRQRTGAAASDDDEGDGAAAEQETIDMTNAVEVQAGSVQADSNRSTVKEDEVAVLFS